MKELLLYTLLSFTGGLLLTGCSGAGSSTVSYEEAAYATVFLGPDGRVIPDPRAPKRDGSNPRSPGRGNESPTGHRASLQGHWEGDGVAGAPSIVIDLGRQEAIFYKGGKPVGRSPVSTGREGYKTPTGSFRVTQKNIDHVSNLYGNFVDPNGNVVVSNVGVHKDRRPPGTRFQGAPMPYFMRVHGAVGMHAGYIPGYPASHGCIRLPEEMARIYFNQASHGTPVTIKN